MPAIVNIQNLESRLSYRSKIRDVGTRRVRCGLTGFASSTIQTNAGTTDYATGAQVFRTQNMNGLLIPESVEGQFLITPYNTTVYLSGFSMSKATVTATGAQDALIRRRFIFPFALPAGRSVGNFRLWTPGQSSVDYASGGNGFVESNAGSNSGVAGTQTIQANFGRLSAAGALTQISTVTQSRTILNSLGSYLALSLVETSTGTTADDDMLYLELLSRVNQTAKSSGTGEVASLINAGVIAYNSPNYVLFLEFDLA